MSRIINPEGAGKQRTVLARQVIIAIQELMRQPEVDGKTRDLAAYIVLALKEISETIDITVGAWEKRDYWLKADRFRMEWLWSELLGDKMRKAILADDWGSAAAISAQIADKLKGVKLLKRPPKTEFWNGAWRQLISVYRPQS